MLNALWRMHFLYNLLLFLGSLQSTFKCTGFKSRYVSELERNEKYFKTSSAISWVLVKGNNVAHFSFLKNSGQFTLSLPDDGTRNMSTPKLRSQNSKIIIIIIKYIYNILTKMYKFLVILMKKIHAVLYIS